MTAAVAISLAAEAGAKVIELPATAPTPQIRPDEPLDEGLASRQSPIPSPRPEAAPSSDSVGPLAPIPPAAQAPLPRPAVPAEKMSECIDELRTLGVDFSRQAPITDPIGCSVQNPVVLKKFGKGMKVTPDALLDCPIIQTDPDAGGCRGGRK
ncbi:hypothetical protein LB572_20775 [Mesorhizobium sp. BH1-1-5]|uniref:hypothetical protein n=1 Tax=Mesorhizobium sp. BH1-1-5 TaxID=2876661 RepID=UPI001CCA13A3|nr:hypothetical protein [Mesorhizobium sp. BH1-1-5]MBZ9989536.1 hypothetical protein [Mesorhizobium sp. BH1-1-5]